MIYEKPEISPTGTAINSIQGVSKGSSFTDDSIYHDGDFRPTNPAYEADE